MITAYAMLKKAVAIVNYQTGRLGNEQKNLICQTCDKISEILSPTFVSQPGANNGIT
jgi:aspartate ammonia-lyase